MRKYLVCVLAGVGARAAFSATRRPLKRFGPNFGEDEHLNESSSPGTKKQKLQQKEQKEHSPRDLALALQSTPELQSHILQCLSTKGLTPLSQATSRRSDLSTPLGVGHAQEIAKRLAPMMRHHDINQGQTTSENFETSTTSTMERLEDLFRENSLEASLAARDAQRCAVRWLREKIWNGGPFGSAAIEFLGRLDAANHEARLPQNDIRDLIFFHPVEHVRTSVLHHLRLKLPAASIGTKTAASSTPAASNASNCNTSNSSGSTHSGRGAPLAQPLAAMAARGWNKMVVEVVQGIPHSLWPLQKVCQLADATGSRFEARVQGRLARFVVDRWLRGPAWALKPFLDECGCPNFVDGFFSRPIIFPVSFKEQAVIIPEDGTSNTTSTLRGNAEWLLLFAQGGPSRIDFYVEPEIFLLRALGLLAFLEAATETEYLKLWEEFHADSTGTAARQTLLAGWAPPEEGDPTLDTWVDIFRVPVVRKRSGVENDAQGRQEQYGVLPWILHEYGKFRSNDAGAARILDRLFRLFFGETAFFGKNRHTIDRMLGFGFVGDTLLEIENALVHGARVQNTALHEAAKNNMAATVRFLVEAGSDCNKKTLNGRTPLHVAASEGHAAVVEVLLAAKCGAEGGTLDVDARDIDGLPPLHYAAANGHSAVVEALLKDRRVVAAILKAYIGQEGQRRVADMQCVPQRSSGEYSQGHLGHEEEAPPHN